MSNKQQIKTKYQKYVNIVFIILTFVIMYLLYVLYLNKSFGEFPSQKSSGAMGLKTNIEKSFQPSDGSIDIPNKLKWGSDFRFSEKEK